MTLLHGLGGSPLSWENQVAKIPAGVSARAPWLRGLRPGGSESFDVPAASADLLMQLELEGAIPAAIVGHSLGAMVALQMAIDAPESLSHLVLVAGQVRPPKSVMRAQRLAFKMIPAKQFAKSGVSKAKMREAMLAVEGFDASDRLASVTAPTLVVVGDNDRVNRSAAEVIAGGIPGARLVSVPRAGHDVMRDSPAEFNELLWDFLGYPAQAARESETSL
ncbi:MAG: alpha/beta hydrolase [Dermatophilus congolensis]|nr:alpha/beta hydrolase [Dermatophilus congolensis]